MNKLILHIIVNGIAFFAAITLLRDYGINAQQMQWWGYLALALIFGVINAIVRPILTMVGCPFIILTFGLGILLINTLMFYLAGLIGLKFGVGFTVAGFWPAFWGGLIVSAIGLLGSLLIQDTRRVNRRPGKKRTS